MLRCLNKKVPPRKVQGGTGDRGGGTWPPDQHVDGKPPEPEESMASEFGVAAWAVGMLKLAAARAARAK